MKTRYYIIICILIGVLSFNAWFFSFSILTKGDWGYYNPTAQHELLSLPSIWDSRGMGTVNISTSFYPTDVLWGLLSHITSYAVSERIIWLWPSILIAVVSSFLLLKKILRHQTSALIGSLVFTYNGYFMITRSGDVTLAAGYAFAPLVILVFLEALERRDIRLTLLGGFLGFIQSYSTIPSGQVAVRLSFNPNPFHSTIG